jgi:hypothetical protein
MATILEELGSSNMSTLSHEKFVSRCGVNKVRRTLEEKLEDRCWHCEVVLVGAELKDVMRVAWPDA